MPRTYRPADLDDLLICGTCEGFADTPDLRTEIVVRGPRLMWLCGHCESLNAVEIPAELRRFVAAIANDWFSDDEVIDIGLAVALPERFDAAYAELRAGRL